MGEMNLLLLLSFLAWNVQNVHCQTISPSPSPSPPVSVSSFNVTQTTLSISLTVQNLGFAKVLTVDYCDAEAFCNNNSSFTFLCQYSNQISSTEETWTCANSYFETGLSSFTVSYSVNGETYYDLGPEKDGYKASIIPVSLDTFDYEGGYLNASLTVSNLGFAKTLQLDLMPSNSTLPCSYLRQINSTYETWTCNGMVTPSFSSFFQVSYQVNGLVYRDNGPGGNGFTLTLPSVTSTSVPQTTVTATATTTTVSSPSPSPSSSLLPVKVENFTETNTSLDVFLLVENLAFQKSIYVNYSLFDSSTFSSSISCNYKSPYNSSHESWNCFNDYFPQGSSGFIVDYKVLGEDYYDYGPYNLSILPSVNTTSPTSISTSDITTTTTDTPPITIKSKCHRHHASTTTTTTSQAASPTYTPMIILQAFTWDLISNGNRPAVYENLIPLVHEFHRHGFTGVWTPPHTDSADFQGYAPGKWYETINFDAVRGLNYELGKRGILAIGDFVFNHRTAPAVDACTGQYTAFQSPKMGNWAVVSMDRECPLDGPSSSTVFECPPECECGQADTGENNCAFPDLDHTNELVQGLIHEYLAWATTPVFLGGLGFTGGRWDEAKGYDGSYVKEYSRSAGILEPDEGFAVGEILDGDLNVVKKWLDQSDGVIRAFDYPLYYILQRAVSSNDFTLLGQSGGSLISFNSSLAVTFVNNHDVGRSQGPVFNNVFELAKGYTYILTHPGVPCVYWGDYSSEDGGSDLLRSIIIDLMKIRRMAGIDFDATVKLDQADFGIYAAYIEGGERTLAVTIGTSSHWIPTAKINMGDVRPRAIVIGSLNIDHVFTVPHNVLPGETIASLKYQLFAGGKGLNQCISTAISLNGMEEKVAMIGCIGKDGEWLKELMKEYSVNTSGIRCLSGAQESTGKAIIQVVESGGENSIILFPGANLLLTVNDIQSYFNKTFPMTADSTTVTAGSTRVTAGSTALTIEPERWVLFQGEISLASTCDAIKQAKQRKMLICFNPAPCSSALLSSILPLIHCIDLLVVNEGEASSLLFFLSPSSRSDGEKNLSPEEILKELHVLLPSLPLLIMTLGSHGVRGFTSGGYKISFPSLKLDVVIDTTGAGDCFVGYLVGIFIRNSREGKGTKSFSEYMFDLKEGEREEDEDRLYLFKAIGAALIASGLSCTKIGAIGGIPSWGEVEKCLSSFS